jgi:drebrin-like protein
MAALNLSTNGQSINRSYQAVIDAPAPTGAAASASSYGQWAVFSVAAPLASAFQDTSGKESVLKVQGSGGTRGHETRGYKANNYQMAT